MKQIGIFGGTFNPVHIGHLKMAEAARKEYKLSCVYFIPSGVPPHKRKEKLFPAKLRYKWVLEATRKKKYFKVLDIEIKKKKPAYTIYTIKKFSILYPQLSILYFLIGADEFENLKTWKRATELVKLVTFRVLPRPLKNIKAPKIKNLNWKLVHTKPINISSTEITERLKKGKAVKKLLPREVRKILCI